jgi:hypothetical protein
VQVSNEQSLVGEAQAVRKTKEGRGDDHWKRPCPAKGGGSRCSQGKRTGCAKSTHGGKATARKAESVDAKAERDSKRVKSKTSGSDRGRKDEDVVKVRVVKGAEATRMPDSPAVRMYLGSHNHGEQKPKRDAKNSLHHYALLQELSILNIPAMTQACG